MKYKNQTESGIVIRGGGELDKVIINSHSSGTLKLYDGTEGGAQATTTLTSAGACVPASHGQTELTSSGAMVAGTHAVTVFTATQNFQEGVKASAILTSNGTQPTAGQAVVLGAVTYTFQALGTPSTRSATAATVPLGNTTAETMFNLYSALLYSTEMDAVLTSPLVITVTAKAVGTAGNSLAATEDSATLDFDGANTTLTGGVAADTITIGTTVYTPKAVPSAPYDFLIGSTLTASLTNLKNAINGTSSYAGTAEHASVVATASDATTVTLRGRVPGTSLNTVATTETCANASFPDTTLGGGTGASDAGVTTGAATVTIGSITYTVVDELSETYGADAIAYQVKKGANEAAMLDNLKLAINGGSGAGTLYSTGTVAHPYVIATTNSDTVQNIVSRSVGDAAFTAVVNGLATTETMANTAWADSTFGGGTGNSNPAVTSDAATFTIGDTTYTAVIELSETSGATAVANQILWVTSEAVFLDNIKKAINETGIAGTDYSTGTTAHPLVYATANDNTSQVFVSRLAGTVGNSYATTKTLGNYSFTSTVMASGTGTTAQPICNTITFSVVGTTGERVIDFGGAEFTRGLYATFGGTADLTFVFK
jgi:hypothetical protein